MHVASMYFDYPPVVGYAVQLWYRRVVCGSQSIQSVHCKMFHLIVSCSVCNGRSACMRRLVTAAGFAALSTHSVRHHDASVAMLVCVVGQAGSWSFVKASVQYHCVGLSRAYLCHVQVGTDTLE